MSPPACVALTYYQFSQANISNPLSDTMIGGVELSNWTCSDSNFLSVFGVEKTARRAFGTVCRSALRRSREFVENTAAPTAQKAQKVRILAFS